MLIGVGTRDPVTFGATLGVILAAAVGASAWRASRIDLLVALRWEQRKSHRRRPCRSARDAAPYGERKRSTDYVRRRPSGRPKIRIRGSL
jgi:hypothetical protein